MSSLRKAGSSKYNLRSVTLSSNRLIPTKELHEVSRSSREFAIKRKVERQAQQEDRRVVLDMASKLRGRRAANWAIRLVGFAVAG